MFRFIPSVTTIALLLLTGCAESNNPMVVRHKAFMAQQEGDLQSAVKYREQVLKEFPDYPFKFEVYYEQGNDLMKMGELEKAKESFDKVLELNPEANFSFIRRAQLNERMEKPEDALDDSLAALKASPIDQEYADLFYARGNAYLQMGNIERAAENWELALTVTETHVPTLRQLATYFMDYQEFDLALELIETALEVENQNVEFNMMKTSALLGLGEDDKAKEALARAQELDEDNQFQLPPTIEDLQKHLVARTAQPHYDHDQQVSESSADTRGRVLEIAQQYLEAQNYSCQLNNDGQLPHFACEKEGVTYQIYVKSLSSSPGSGLMLRPEELNQITQQSPPAGLIVVGGLNSENPAEGNSGRVIAFTNSWQPDPAKLQPTQYRYELPAAEAN